MRLGRVGWLLGWLCVGTLATPGLPPQNLAPYSMGKPNGTKKPHWVFEGLIRELEKLQEEFPLPVKASSADQEKFAGHAIPRIQRWIDRNMFELHIVLPSFLTFPERNQGYSRNSIFVSQRFGVFSHIWAPGGQTDIHNHNGALALTVALDRGFVEDSFVSSQPLSKPWDHQIVTFDQQQSQLIPVHEVVRITRGKEATHRIRNTGNQFGFMIEIYFWDQPMTEVNNPIPIEGSRTQFFILRTSTKDLPYSISERLRSLILIEVSEDFLQPENLTDSIFPIFTTENTAIINPEQLLSYLDRKSPRIYRLTNGSFLLEPIDIFSDVVDSADSSQAIDASL